jgi:hypothetical protein
LAEVRDVLADRLMSLEVEPPANRYGRVFVGSPHQARGRSFRIVFVPGLAERLFPQKLREDPLLVDDLRKELNASVAQGFSPVPGVVASSPALAVRDDRADLERLLLRFAVGAATERLYVSFPRIETAEARQRVPSFYALEVMRAVTGKIPDHQRLETQAAQEANASLAWPAPQHADDAIDDFEHDLSVLRVLMRSSDDVKGHAHYMLRLNDCLRRSATERWARSKSQWSQFDGIVRVTDATRPYLQEQRSVSGRTPSRRFRTTRTARIDFCCPRSTGSSRSKSPSRFSGSIRSRKGACSTKCRPSSSGRFNGRRSRLRRRRSKPCSRFSMRRSRG